LLSIVFEQVVGQIFLAERLFALRKCEETAYLLAIACIRHNKVQRASAVLAGYQVSIGSGFLCSIVVKEETSSSHRKTVIWLLGVFLNKTS